MASPLVCHLPLGLLEAWPQLDLLVLVGAAALLQLLPLLQQLGKVLLQLLLLLLQLEDLQLQHLLGSLSLLGGRLHPGGAALTQFLQL